LGYCCLLGVSGSAIELLEVWALGSGGRMGLKGLSRVKREREKEKTV